MDRKKILTRVLYLVILSIICFSSCRRMPFYDTLTLVLGIKSLEIIESCSYSSQMSCIAVKYILSEETTSEFLLKKDKVFPASTFYTTWSKAGWFNSSRDTLATNIKYYLDLYWQKDIEKLQLAMKEALNKDNTYFAYYYNAASGFTHHVQLFVYDTSANTIYIIDVGI